MTHVSDELDLRIAGLAAAIEGEPFWRAVVGPETQPHLARAVLREAYLEIVWYQPDVIEATVAAIGQMPRSLAPKSVQSMLLHQVEEWDQGRWRCATTWPSAPARTSRAPRA